MITKQQNNIAIIHSISVLAKIKMLTKQKKKKTKKIISVRAIILMVTIPLFDLAILLSSSVLAKILMVTKHLVHVHLVD